mmetsp:Transcript_21104/g.50119  ORF Transcript_21104/g.50119 Transcript_21104/m.50119 type:complete len:219 (+) Transcript_21104:1585-2241(+)
MRNLSISFFPFWIATCTGVRASPVLEARPRSTPCSINFCRSSCFPVFTACCTFCTSSSCICFATCSSSVICCFRVSSALAAFRSSSSCACFANTKSSSNCLAMVMLLSSSSFCTCSASFKLSSSSFSFSCHARSIFFAVFSSLKTMVSLLASKSRLIGSGVAVSVFRSTTAFSMLCLEYDANALVSFFAVMSMPIGSGCLLPIFSFDSVSTPIFIEQL